MKKAICLILSAAFFFATAARVHAENYIKWVDFTVNESAICDALDADVESFGSDKHIHIYELLSALAVKYGGDFRHYKKKDLDTVCEKYNSGMSFTEITNNEKLYNYYYKAYSSIFSGMVCEYDEYTLADSGTTVERKYGLCAYSPFAAGYYYGHFDDFGVSRSYGYKRRHLGHDMMGSVGTPIIAVESGYVEACGWNQYGGWRIGIRSFDGLRYYYYAHLRKNHPYTDIYEGKVVAAGEVIGYLGMTGYSSRENVNNIDTPHLHWGLQLIFDKSQKDGYNQIWIDVYSLTNFLSKYRAKTAKNQTDSYSKTYKVPLYMWD